MQCQHVDEHGHPCGAKPLTGREFCFFHCQDRKVREMRRQAQTRGGSQPKKKAPLPPLNFNFGDPRTMPEALSQMADEVRAGTLAPKTATAIGQLMDRALDALKVGFLAEELAEVRRIIEAEKGLPPDFLASIEHARKVEDDRTFKERVVELSRVIQADMDQAEARRSTYGGKDAAAKEQDDKPADRSSDSDRAGGKENRQAADGGATYTGSAVDENRSERK